MPCRDWELEKESISKEQEQAFKTDIAKAKQRADENARLLCEACQILTDNKMKDKMSKDLSDWWWKHSKEDRKRK